MCLSLSLSLFLTRKCVGVRETTKENNKKKFLNKRNVTGEWILLSTLRIRLLIILFGNKKLLLLLIQKKAYVINRHFHASYSSVYHLSLILSHSFSLILSVGHATITSLPDYYVSAHIPCHTFLEFTLTFNLKMQLHYLAPLRCDLYFIVSVMASHFNPISDANHSPNLVMKLRRWEWNVQDVRVKLHHESMFSWLLKDHTQQPTVVYNVKKWIKSSSVYVSLWFFLLIPSQIPMGLLKLLKRNLLLLFLWSLFRVFSLLSVVKVVSVSRWRYSFRLRDKW